MKDKDFALAGSRVERRLTGEHSPGGMTFSFAGLIAIVGDSLLPGSYGWRDRFYKDAFEQSRENSDLADETFIVRSRADDESSGREADTSVLCHKLMFEAGIR